MNIKDVRSVFSACGIQLDDNKALLFLQYAKILRRENQKYNLTRITEPLAILEEHFCDSLAGSACRPENGAQILDLGSGAGFPGLPIKIFIPGIKLILVEAVRKKIVFLGKVVRELGLEGVTLWQCRAEDLARSSKRESFSMVTARAVATLVVILELALPLVEVGGVFSYWGGKKTFQELTFAKNILQRCGGKLAEIKSYQLPFSGKERKIFRFEKVAPAEESFPRKSGIPQKRPWF